MNELTLRPINSSQYVVFLRNGKGFGTIETADDGYFYYYFPTERCSGFVDTSLLKELIDKIDELNEPYDRLVDQQLQKAATKPHELDLPAFFASI